MFVDLTLNLWLKIRTYYASLIDVFLSSRLIYGASNLCRIFGTFYSIRSHFFYIEYYDDILTIQKFFKKR